MPDPKSNFSEQLFQRLQGKGLKKSQILKVLSLQRLNDEVLELGTRGLLSEGAMLEISKIASPARQKQLAELVVRNDLPTTWVRELSKLIRMAERAPGDREANRVWDFYFGIKETIEKQGATPELLAQIERFRGTQADSRILNPALEFPAGRGGEIVDFRKLDLNWGRGLDIGTVNVVTAVMKMDGDTVYNLQRNAFIEVRSDAFTQRMLMKLGIDHFTHGEKGYVIGDSAFELANIFEKNTRRPMKEGLISPTEPEALTIVGLLVSQLLGPPREVGEICAFSVPADPIDAERNIIYHSGALEAILRKLGYNPRPVVEGYAVVMAELASQEYTGIGISCGGGMFNVCLTHKGIPSLAFSTSRGGDWIDGNVATALGTTAPQICAVKEKGLDLRHPKNHTEEAIVIYYRNLIRYTLETTRQSFEASSNMPTFTRPIDLVCAGGTSLIGGFIDVFQEEFAKTPFPFDIRTIRLAKDPLKTIVTGCLKVALDEAATFELSKIPAAPQPVSEPAKTPTLIIPTDEIPQTEESLIPTARISPLPKLPKKRETAVLSTRPLPKIPKAPEPGEAPPVRTERISRPVLPKKIEADSSPDGPQDLPLISDE